MGGWDGGWVARPVPMIASASWAQASAQQPKPQGGGPHVGGWVQACAHDADTIMGTAMLARVVGQPICTSLGRTKGWPTKIGQFFFRAKHFFGAKTFFGAKKKVGDKMCLGAKQNLAPTNLVAPKSFLAPYCFLAPNVFWRQRNKNWRQHFVGAKKFFWRHWATFRQVSRYVRT